MSDKSMRDRLRGPSGYAAAGMAAAIVAVIIYAIVQYVHGRPAISDKPLGVDSARSSEGADQLRRTSESFRSIAKKVGPAVVNVKSTRGQPKGRAGGRLGRRFHRPTPEEEDPFRGGDPFNEFAPNPQQPETPQVSLGSGILVDKSGIVVTNNHVIEDASEITVMLSGDEKHEVKAKVIGTDPKTDLAVLRLADGGNYPVAEWADSDSVEVGDWAIAIGSPFALGNSVTLGIVSAKGRSAQELTGSGYGGDLIQTDAAINPGNSGGPLCDLDGRVMGVNTAIYTRSGGYMGIGFAIPSNSAKEVVGKLIKDGRVTRGWLGIYIQPLDPELARELGIKEGVAVHEVLEDGPAAKAGLNAGDVIIEADGKPVKDVAPLQRAISNYKPGQSVKLKVVGYNDKKTREVTVKIGTLPEKEPESGGAKEEEPDKLGLVVTTAHGGGAQIEAVQPGSFADEQLRLEVGDVLLRINRKPIDSPATYKKLLESSKQIALEVKRKGRTLFFRFTLPD